jgi:endo-1,4-beta-xylanase
MKCRQNGCLKLCSLLLACFITSGLAPHAYAQEGKSGGTSWQPTLDPTFVPGGAVDPVPTEVNQAQGTGNVVALTFDDGPNPGETDELLDFLAENDITAVFCVIGQNITAPGGAELLQRMVNEGHVLCNHTTSYADMGSWSYEAVEADLKENLAIIREALGDPEAQVPYFRAPNGSWGITPEVAVALGMQPLGLGNLIFDWDGNDQSEQTLTQNLREAMTPGAVVLVHDGGGVRETSIAAVRTVVAEDLAEGWTFTLPAGGLQ